VIQVPANLSLVTGTFCAHDTDEVALYPAHHLAIVSDVDKERIYRPFGQRLYCDD
jgi:hypothetical protein